MDLAEEQLDYGDEDHAIVNGAISVHFHGGRAAAAAEEELEEEIPDEDDDDYDDLYQDVNVPFIDPDRLHLPLPNPQIPLPHQTLSDPPPQFQISPPRPTPPPPNPPLHPELDHQGAVGLSSSTPAPPEEESPRFLGRRVGGESTSGHRSSSGAPGTPTSTPRRDPDFSAARGGGAESGASGMRTVFVGELHWWTTDAELEAALSEYGRVKEIAFFQERASGKSKGFCQVHFCDSASARACKEGMNGRVFNGRACVVAFKSPRSVKHMAEPGSGAKDSKRMVANDGGGMARGGGGGYDGGTRNYGRSGRGSGGGQGRGLGQGRGRSSKGTSGGGHYGQGLLGPMGMQPQPQHQSQHGGLMPMGNQGFDPNFGRGGSGWPSFPGMVPPYPGSMGIPLAGVAPHVNPAFFNRGLGGNGMGMMPSANANSPGMEQSMWADWGGEDSSYGYGDKGGGGGRSNPSRVRDSEWIGNTAEKRHRIEKDVDWERDRERYREKERGLYRDQRNNWDKDEDYERGRDRERVGGARPRSKSRALEEDESHSHPRPLPDYGKRRR